MQYNPISPLPNLSRQLVVRFLRSFSVGVLFATATPSALYSPPLVFILHYDAAATATSVDDKAEG